MIDPRVNSDHHIEKLQWIDDETLKIQDANRILLAKDKGKTITSEPWDSGVLMENTKF